MIFFLKHSAVETFNMKENTFREQLNSHWTLPSKNQIYCRLSESSLGVTVDNRSEVRGQTGTRTLLRTVLGSIAGAGDSQYFSFGTERKESGAGMSKQPKHQVFRI